MVSVGFAEGLFMVVSVFLYVNICYILYFWYRFMVGLVRV